LAPPITWHVLKHEHLQLGLYDIVNTPGVAADLSHIATPAKVEGYLPPDDGLAKTLKGADIVIIPAGVPRKPGVRINPRICIYSRIELIHLFR
jgi:malate dehydrogenase